MLSEVCGRRLGVCYMSARSCGAMQLQLRAQAEAEAAHCVFV